MITFSIIKSWFIKDGKRKLNIFEYGAKTAYESAPFGDDSNPIKDMTAIYARTGNKGESVVIGYINRNQLAETGEKRLYSLNSAGVVQSYIWLKNNGELLLNGDSKSIVRYEDLNAALQTFASLLNTQLQTAITAGVASSGGAYTPISITIDISGSKVENVKTN